METSAITYDDVQLTLREVEKLEFEELPEFLYGHLSQCILSAIYSLQHTPTVERDIVQRYADWARLAPIYRPGRQAWLSQEQQQPLNAFIEHIEARGAGWFAKEVLHNERPMAPRQAPFTLRSETCLRFAQVCVSKGILYVQDAFNEIDDPAFEAAIKQVYGLQARDKDAVAFPYFCMLVGSEKHVKKDNRLNNFFKRVLGRELSFKDMRILLSAVASFTDYTPRQLDAMIWQKEAERANEAK